MTVYRVVLTAITAAGRPLPDEYPFEVEVEQSPRHWREGDMVTEAITQADKLFYARTSFVCGVKLGVRRVERQWESGKGWTELVTAYRATPGTWIKLESVYDGQPWWGWRCVARWEPTGDGTCRLITTHARNPQGGVYGRDDVFEKRRV
jgi:hypothetical protein